MALVTIASLDDARLAAYRNLKDRELAREGGRFIAEGEHVVRRLLASRYRTESLLVAERKAVEMADAASAIAALRRGGGDRDSSEEPPIYVVPNELLTSVIGFKFHSGVMAVGLRGETASLETIANGDGAEAPSRQGGAPTAQSETTRTSDREVACAPPCRDGASRFIVVCADLINADNLGSIVRIATGMGADAMLLGERCCDPFWRRAIRVSMGNVFHLPLRQSDNLAADLLALHERYGYETMATVLDEDAMPLRIVTPPPRGALVLGSESQGLHPRYVRACRSKITIPMHHGTDSLNVAVAAAVFLYHFVGNK